ncbi:fasciclin domain-containing protein [Qipengyuania aurantiaca]|uniref:Fasciclin domain-containing protein n=1 Tax=Qipengyuania aurantiaca TaxID=2867233 RepID=A0ABX8ZMD4_9SPHN|nr:fasciclin domain-containing protein [Qipengyuania aurantiaca]QZD90162.1 fasciclin domain-containing protein [Qipengyuania aurantiaca]
MMKSFSKPFVLAGAIAGLALLPACSSDADTAEAETATQDTSTRTLAASLGDLPDMASLNGAISSAELGSVFDGPASYTLLAPNDSAFEALGGTGSTLMAEEQRPLLVGVLREHILPGHLTPENIQAALESQGGEVSMTTLGGGSVTFTQEGDTIMVANDSGAKASFVGSATAANNGVIIPLDTVLVPEETAGA